MLNSKFKFHQTFYIPDRLMRLTVKELGTNDVFLIPRVLMMEELKLPKVFRAEPRADAMGMRKTYRREYLRCQRAMTQHKKALYMRRTICVDSGRGVTSHS